MSKRPRRRYSPEEKARILRLHLLEQVPISEICEKQGIHPTMFYQWQKALFENAAAALEGQRGTRSTSRQRQAMEAMESKLKRKDEVLAVVVEEMVRLKKELGGKLTVIWVAHDIRDTVVDFVRYWSELTELPVCRFLEWIELSPRKFGRWQQRFGKLNEHNGLVR